MLDPANNQIKYYPPNSESDPTYQWVYNGVLYNSATAACSAFWNKTGFGWTFVSVDRSDREYPVCVGYNAEQNRYDAYQPTQRVARIEPIEQKNLSLITVAQQVIENAESDNLDAQFTVLAAATNILSEAEQDDSKAKPIADELDNNSKCPSGIVRNGSCWVCDKSLFMPYTRATRDAKNATRGKSCKNVTDTTVKAANATLFRNLINARVQENACWLPPDPNHAIALIDAQNALSLCEN
ncbi:hypothetical protein [Acinetobacter sp. NyZ410]|uniref:hypothetical protein n=1 Tax=Acinetobacter sp. NyZ410 TaxID=2929509 RepID=UPI001FBBB1D7|nr:hypothetical protein [Acinetobacter sp. NyZ410]UOH17117.1 hypothetical protein MTO68_14940 [Acinetobacter sp. NyZ410]